MLDNDTPYDIILAGGGLANGLLAYCLKTQRPELRVLLIESGKTLGGNHTWSFHRSDIANASWIQPLISQQWDAYDVRFPAYERQLNGGYASIVSSSFHTLLSDALGDAVLLERQVLSLSATTVTLDDHVTLHARCVIDGRGSKGLHSSPMGFQKFLGWELELERPHGLAHPVLMDATVPQVDGFRFFYLLPLSDTRLLVEDTRYSEHQHLDEPSFRAEVQQYCDAKGWRIRNMEREEKGVLAIPFFVPRAINGSDGVPAIGLSGGFFHPVTGYSLPQVVRVANGIGALPDITSAAVYEWLDTFRASQRLQMEFLAFLNRMLFHAAEPETRYRVLQHFYRLSPALIDRFYGVRLKRTDFIRILSGRPPVPVLRALRCLRRPGVHRLTQEVTE